MDKWMAIFGSITIIGFLGLVAVMSNGESRLKIEQEKTKQLELQIQLEK